MTFLKIYKVTTSSTIDPEGCLWSEPIEGYIKPDYEELSKKAEDCVLHHILPSVSVYGYSDAIYVTNYKSVCGNYIFLYEFIK